MEVGNLGFRWRLLEAAENKVAAMAMAVATAWGEPGIDGGSDGARLKPRRRKRRRWRWR